MRRRVLGLLPVIGLFLIGARAPVYPLPDALLPDTNVQIGTPFVVRPGDVILRAKIVRTEKTYLDESVHAEIAKFSDDMGSGDVLTTVVSNNDAKKIVGSNADVYYCGDDIKARSSFMAGFIGDLGSKFENIVRFCFVDDDGDQKFEHYFLSGSKDPTFLAKRPIGPLSYHTERLVHENEADEIRLRYRKFESRTAELHLELEIVRNGKPLPFEYIITPSHVGRNQQYYRLSTDPRKLPYPMHFADILGANIGIRSVTGEGEATVLVNRNFDASLLKPYSPQVQYIFIYI